MTAARHIGAVYGLAGVGITGASTCSSRCRGLFTARLIVSKTIVGRCSLLKGGHAGNPGALGDPVRANAIQAALMVSATFCASGAPGPMRDSERATLSNTSGTSSE